MKTYIPYHKLCDEVEVFGTFDEGVPSMRRHDGEEAQRRVEQFLAVGFDVARQIHAEVIEREVAGTCM